MSLGPLGGPGGWNPPSGTVPAVGLRPYTPQKLAGIRIEPVRSEPYSRKVRPVATAAAPPPVEPPGERVVSHGLTVRPYSGLAHSATSASICATLVVPNSTAPAERSRDTTTASR